MKQTIWAEKYRPTTIEDCVLPLALKNQFQAIVDSKDKTFPSMLFYGGSGTGKTTVAKALCEQTGHEWFLINGSKDSGIDVLRTTIEDFASSIPNEAHRKCVIIDEAEYLNPTSTQPALRAFMEEYAAVCSFIFTCNNKYRIIKHLHSRCQNIDFTIPEDEKKTICAGIFKSIKNILKAEEIPFDEKVIAQHIVRYYPDFRRAINELEGYAKNGKIDIGILSRSEFSSKSLEQITDILMAKDFEGLYKWSMSSDYDPAIYSELFDFWYKNEKLRGQKLSSAILLCSQYEERSTREVNPRLTLCAFLTDVMMNCL